MPKPVTPVTVGTPATNAFGQPIGGALPNWTPRPLPPRAPMAGRSVRLEPLSASRHGDDLAAAFEEDDGRMWTYMAVGPFNGDRSGLDAWLTQCEASADPLFHTVISTETEKALGYASYLRIEPAPGVIEVGNITLSPTLQRTVMATETMYLMMRHVFEDLGYRRYEWKCDSLNAPSRAAAARLGFTFEGVFRQATIYKGRNRDTAWFSILDSEWPALKSAFEGWLEPGNFAADGSQIRPLGDFRIPA